MNGTSSILTRHMTKQSLRVKQQTIEKRRKVKVEITGKVTLQSDTDYNRNNCKLVDGLRKLRNLRFR